MFFYGILHEKDAGFVQIIISDFWEKAHLQKENCTRPEQKWLRHSILKQK